MKAVDLAFIGSGFSSAMTLRSVINTIEAKQAAGSLQRIPLHITLIDKNADFGTGIAYGKSANPLFLLNAPTKEMIVSTKGNEFLEWVKNNRSRWEDFLHEKSGPHVAHWFEENRENLDKENYGDIFMPRSVCGMFLKEEYEKTKERASALGIEIDEVSANAVAVNKSVRGYGIEVVDKDGQQSAIKAKQVVLGLGASPKRPSEHMANAPTFFDDIYQLGMDNVKDQILAHNPGEKKRVLLMGTNASFMDIVHYVYNHPELRNEVELIGISRKGTMPPPGISHHHPAPYEPKFLRLDNDDTLTAQGLLDAAWKDIAAGAQEGYSSLEVRSDTATVRDKLLNRLPPAQRELFTANFGARYEIGALNITATDSYNEAQELISEGTLKMLSGDISYVRRSADHLVVKYKTEKGEEECRAECGINCMGSPKLSECGNPLIEGLLKPRGLAKVNASGKGLQVNDDFESDKNLYVIGPLLAGGSNKHGHYHYLEGAGGIAPIIPKVADIIASRLVARGQHASAHNSMIIAHRGLKDASMANPEENTLPVTEAAWRSGHPLETDVRVTSDGVPVIQHDRYLDAQKTLRVDDLTYDEIQQHKKLATLENLLDLQVKIKKEGKHSPVMQLEIKAPCDTDVLVQTMLPYLRNGSLTPDDIFLTSFHADLLGGVKDSLAQEGFKLKSGLLLSAHALEYTSLSLRHADSVQKLAHLIQKTIVEFDKEGVISIADSAALLGIDANNVQHSIARELVIGPSKKLRASFEKILSHAVGSALEAGYYLDRPVAKPMDFSAVHVPMICSQGVSEDYAKKAKHSLPDHIINAHSVSCKGQYPHQIIRALGCISDKGSFTIDYPAQVDQVMQEIFKRLALGNNGDQIKIKLDTTQIFNQVTSSPVSGKTLDAAIERYLSMRNIAYEKSDRQVAGRRVAEYSISCADLTRQTAIKVEEVGSGSGRA
jgi:uncharacterized NAD(P)/FAD-binding protein YdhS